MADKKFSQFGTATEEAGDFIVGLHDGVNAKFPVGSLSPQPLFDAQSGLSGAVVLTNPSFTVYGFSFDSPGGSVLLPPANDPDAALSGGRIEYWNEGAIDVAIKNAGGIVLKAALKPGAVQVLYSRDTSTANGNWSGYTIGTIAGQQANAVALTGGVLTNITFNNGVIDSTSIGEFFPDLGIFTDLTATSSFALDAALSGSALISTINNSSNTASSDAVQTISVGGATAGDPMVRWIVNGATAYSMGIDNSASDALVLSRGVTLGTTNIMSVTTAGLINFTTLRMTTSASSSGVDVATITSNTSNTAGSGAVIAAEVAGTSSGDAATSWGINSGTSFRAGYDTSATQWKLSQGTALGTNDIMAVTTAGEISYPLQPCFSAYLSATASNATGDGTTVTVVANTELFDQNADYNNATGNFTASVGMRLVVFCGATFSSVGGSSFVTYIDTSNRAWQAYGMNATNTKDGASNLVAAGNSFLIDMDAGDTANFKVQVSGGGKTTAIVGSASVPATYFAAYMAA